MKHVRSAYAERHDFLGVIGSGLRRARRERGWSQRELARLASVDQSLISRLENGIAPGIRYERFVRILWALEWPVTRRESARLGFGEPPPLRPPWSGT